MIVFASFIYPQQTEFIEKTEFGNKALGGECIIKSSKLSVDGETTMKKFEIEVPADGEYYLSAWMMDTGIIEKNSGLKFFVDDENNPAGNIKPAKEGWQNTILLKNDNSKAEKLKLTAGKHLITFCSVVPEFPPVEFIKIAKNENDAIIAENNWTNFFEAAKNNKKAPAKDSLRNGKLMKVNVENPYYAYDQQLNTYFTYTYFTYLYLNTGTYIFETKKDNPYASDPIMYLFNQQDPAYGSWGDDDGGQGYQSKITCTIQNPGTYCIFVRSFSSNQSQTTDLYMNDNLYASNIVISGAKRLQY